MWRKWMRKWCVLWAVMALCVVGCKKKTLGGGSRASSPLPEITKDVIENRTVP